MTKLKSSEWAAAVPLGMRALPRWVGWRLGEPDERGHRAKQPLDLAAGSYARTNDPATFGTFEQARRFYQEHEAEPDVGVGFVFTKGDGLVFVDLDHCLVPGSGPLPESCRSKEWAALLLLRLCGATYSEVSPSGEGVHVFALGELPRAEGVSGARAEVEDGAVEAYAERRFSTVTGVRYGAARLGPVPGGLESLLPADLLAKLRREAPPAAPAQARESLDRRREVWEALQALDPDVPEPEWVKYGMALKAAFGDEGLPLWDKWSSRGRKYRPGEPAQRWRSFRRQGVGLGTLFRAARLAGWAPPEQGPREAFAEYTERRDFWTVPLSEVEDEELEWLVRDQGLALGYASLLAGDGGVGKSIMTLDVAARLTRGLPMPWERGGAERAPSRVYYLNAEDGQGDTIKPRARAAGADLSRLEVLDLAGGSRVPQLPDDAEQLDRMVRDLGDAQLVVVDPLNAFLGRDVDAHKAHDIRQALQPLGDALKRSRQSVRLVAHLNKNEATSALYRVSGSADQVMFVRTALLVARDPESDDEDARVVAPLKWNLGRPPPARSFRVRSLSQDVGLVEWGDESEAAADDLTRRPEGGRGGGGRVQECEAWLRSRLAAGSVPSRVLEPEARAAGFPRATLNRAAARMGLRRERDDLAGGWRWPRVETFKEES